MTTRLAYHQQLNDALYELCAQTVPLQNTNIKESNEELLSLFSALELCFANGDDYTPIGQQIITRIVSHYPAITPQVHRDLFWFYGGDCLHFLSDDEIQKYQTLEERYYDLSKTDSDACYRNLRAQIFNMH
ncbi:PA2817 family protein [Zhongshania aliphaticivorans]|uniref:PA2817 family protein n=1 Tax=Zhongshania aliphaticivorans TaxID=1470434 RepID=UPI0013309D02|nr:PA2817 family protein [Zhongshania aliphaticivorans]